MLKAVGYLCEHCGNSLTEYFETNEERPPTIKCKYCENQARLHDFPDGSWRYREND